MDTDDTSAMRAGPFFLFFKQKFPGTDGSDANDVFDQACLISLSVAFIESLDRRAWKGRTLEAKINPVADGAVPPAAPPAVIWLAALLSSAALAGILFSKVRIANCAVHPAWSQQDLWYFRMHLHVITSFAISVFSEVISL